VANVGRIRTMRHVHAMVALDTVALLTERVTNLLRAGRRMTTTRRYTHTGTPPEVVAGLTLDGRIETWTSSGSAGVCVRLKSGMSGFGFSAHQGEADTEAEAWKRYHATPGDRRDLTLVTITGGLPGAGPGRDDRIVVLRWNQYGVCDEQVVAFDYDTGRVNDLTVVRDELREHVANLADMQPWGNRAMFERLLAVLNVNAAAAGGESDHYVAHVEPIEKG
jgi:hypothetical protein